MPPRKVTVMGGPADGARVTPTSTIRYITVSGRSFKDPGPGRAAYRRTDLGYVYTLACKGCGAAFDNEHRPDTCPLCGAPTRGETHA